MKLNGYPLPERGRDRCPRRVVMPGFVDSHTHLVYAAQSARLRNALRGADYHQIAEAGGTSKSS